MEWMPSSALMGLDFFLFWTHFVQALGNVLEVGIGCVHVLEFVGDFEGQVSMDKLLPRKDLDKFLVRLNDSDCEKNTQTKLPLCCRRTC